jgi:hypothetical protein
MNDSRRPQAAARSATRPYRGLRGARPVVVTAAAWLRQVVQVDGPSGTVKFDPAPRRLVDVPGADAPLYLDGPDRADALLVVGDSRASSNLSLRVLSRETGLPAAVLWNGFAQFDLLLRGVRQLAPRRLLVSLTPVALYAPPMRRMRTLLERERAKTPMQRIDERLDDDLDAWRGALLRPVDLSLYRTWTALEGIEPERQVGMYADLLAVDQDARAARWEELRAGLAALQADGWSVACVRLPTQPALECIEDERYDPARWRVLCADLGAPLLDLSGGDWRTSDGSHLLGKDAEEVTLRVAAWLRWIGWCAPQAR